MFTGEERAIDIPGLKIAALEWGPAHGIPILALHGWVDNAASFSFLAPLLTNAHVIALDSPGCGHSSHRPVGVYPSVVDESFKIMQAADALGFDKFVLLAHSRGATVAQLIAAGCPKRVSGLIVIDNVGLHARPVLSNLRQSLEAVLKNKPRPATLYKALDDAVRGRMLAGTIDYESAKALTLRGAAAVDGGYKWTFDRREMLFINPVPFAQEQAEDILKGIEAPTCIILADQGIIPRETAEILAQLIQHHELHWVAGHHHVHMDDPKPVAKIINNFLSLQLGGCLP